MKNLNFYQYVNDKSLLVVTSKGLLKRLYCPFPVCLKNDFNMGNTSNIMIVKRIELDVNGKLCYGINGKAVPYNYFKIMT